MAPKKQAIEEEKVEAVAATEVSNSSPKEQMVPLSEVKKLIREALADQNDSPKKPEKPDSYMASLCRLDSKWVIDFKDHNKDPYVTTKVETVKKWIPESKEFVSFVTLIFSDGSEKEMPLNLFMRYATPISCRIVERKKKDRSYSIGQVEEMVWKGDRKVGTGNMVEQKVTMHDDIFVIQTPDGLVVEVPGSVINLIQAPNSKKSV